MKRLGGAYLNHYALKDDKGNKSAYSWWCSFKRAYGLKSHGNDLFTQIKDMSDDEVLV